jgi:DNA-binding MarR family transcriptional regulator
MGLGDNVIYYQHLYDFVNQMNAKPSDNVLDLIHRVMHQYRARQHQSLRDGAHNLTHMESRVLSFFGNHAGARQSELAVHNGRDKAQLARLIKGLRERSLLTAQADPEDKRNVQLSLTPRGTEMLHELRQQTRQLNAKAVTGLSPSEQQQLVALLTRLSANLQD